MPLLLILLAVLLLLVPAYGHDSWISRGGHKNTAGEWCCGDGDCFMVGSAAVTGWEVLALQAAGWNTAMLLRATAIDVSR